MRGPIMPGNYQLWCGAATGVRVVDEAAGAHSTAAGQAHTIAPVAQSMAASPPAVASTPETLVALTSIDATLTAIKELLFSKAEMHSDGRAATDDVEDP